MTYFARLTGRVSRPTRVVAAVAVTTLAAGSLAGCVPSSSTAVEVGDQKVSMETFQKDLDACSSLAVSDTMTPRQVIATTVTRGAVGEALLARSGRTLSTAARDEVLKANDLTVLESNPTCHQMGRSLASLYAVVQTTDEKTLMAQIGTLDVQVNPRLGGWQPEQLLVAGSSSLSNLWAGTRS